MSGLYDHALFSQEISYEELEPGQTFPPFSYVITPEHLEAYLKSVEEPGFNVEGVEDAIVPTLVALNYGFFYSAMRRRPPTGYINSAVEFSFRKLVRVGAKLTMLVRVGEKFIKRDRKYVIFVLDVRDSFDDLLASAKVDCIFPK